MKNTQKAVFFTELDVLLDTRLGCLVTHFPNDVNSYLQADYLSRKVDSFGKLKSREFMKLYKKRDRQVLMNSLVTNFQDVLIQFATELKVKNASAPYDIENVLEVNVHPYVLSETEIEQLSIAISTTVCGMFTIKMVNLPIAKITPLYVKDHYVYMAMYHFNEWLDYHTETGVLQKCTMPGVVLYGPAVYFNDELNADDFARSRKGKTVFDTLEVISSMVIGLTLIDIFYFSFYMPKDMKSNQQDPQM